MEVTLIAENNDILAAETSDEDGRVHFASPLVSGEGALRARLLLAYGDDADLAMLDLRRPALDLSDYPVGGRRFDGALDAFVYLDRGIYRPGETVRMTALMRDAAGRAAESRGVQLIFRRPNGVEAHSARLTPDASGAITYAFETPASAPRGVWRAELRADGVEQPVGGTAFSVEDFVPQRIAVDVDAETSAMATGEARAIGVLARFLYGAPGAGLSVRGEARLRIDPNPFPQHEGYQFGVVGEAFQETLVDMGESVADGDGAAELVLNLADAPDSSLPLRADVVVGVREPGGREVRESVRIPVRTRKAYIGVKPLFDGGAASLAHPAEFEVMVADKTGAPLESAVEWEMVREDWRFDWYQDNGAWRWRRSARDTQVAAGRIDTAPGAPHALSQKLDWGQYRLVLRTPDGTAKTAYRFYAGWRDQPAGAPTPDRVAITPAKRAGAGGRYGSHTNRRALCRRGADCHRQRSGAAHPICEFERRDPVYRNPHPRPVGRGRVCDGQCDHGRVPRPSGRRRAAPWASPICRLTRARGPWM